MFLNKLLPLVFLLALTSCTLPFTGENQTTDSNPNVQTESQTETENQGVISSIVEAFRSGQGMKCTYTNTEAGEVTILAKNNKTRIKGIDYNMGEGQTYKGGVINDGEWVYFWDDTTKAGMKYEIDSLETPETEESTSDWEDMDEWAQEVEEEEDVNCTPENVSDSEFIPPADVQFQDMAELMNVVNQFQDMDPSQFPGVDMETLQQMGE